VKKRGGDMYRNMIRDLAEWQENPDRPILLLKGAKGVGKTWCVVDFAEAFFPYRLHIEFEKDTVLRDLFLSPHPSEFIDEQLELLSDLDLKGYHKDEILLIFDDVQVEEDLFAGVMQYARQKSNVSVIVIASWFGLLAAEGLLAEEMTVKYMYPMTFEEFMIANKAQELCRIIEQEKVHGMNHDLMPIVLDYLRQFYLTGGMPEVVHNFIHNRNYEQVDLIQSRLLHEMRDDILKYAPKFYVKKILQVWDSVPSQLMKDNKKFMYGFIDSKARAREYVGAVNWLVNAGYVRKINKIREGRAPISEQIDRRSFELYYLDHGLLRNSFHIPATEAESDKQLFDLMQGILSEQFVLAELTMNQNVDKLYFWTSEATARIDFVFEDDTDIIPVDVQATIRKKAQNLKVFHQKYGNRMAIRISMEPLSFHKGLLNVPLYGLWNF
jgi:hypothetical protein